MIKRTPIDRHRITEDIYSTALMPLFYHPDIDQAKSLMKVCYDAGLRVIEFTNRAAYALDVFIPLNQYVKKELPGMRLGIGTVTDVGTAAMYLQYGADFIVMPTLQEEVISLCNKRKVLCIPGCGTVTEISKAETMGCELVKLFPGNHFGPGFIKDVLGPMPWCSILVSGGVEPTKESIQAWLEAGATCLALGSKLFTSDVLAGHQNESLSTSIKDCLAWAKQSKSV